MFHFKKDYVLNSVWTLSPTIWVPVILSYIMLETTTADLIETD